MKRKITSYFVRQCSNERRESGVETEREIQDHDSDEADSEDERSPVALCGSEHDTGTLHGVV